MAISHLITNKDTLDEFFPRKKTVRVQYSKKQHVPLNVKCPFKLTQLASVSGGWEQGDGKSCLELIPASCFRLWAPLPSLCPSAWPCRLLTGQLGPLGQRIVQTCHADSPLSDCFPHARVGITCQPWTRLCRLQASAPGLTSPAQPETGGE